VGRNKRSALRPPDAAHSIGRRPGSDFSERVLKRAGAMRCAYCALRPAGTLLRPIVQKGASSRMNLCNERWITPGAAFAFLLKPFLTNFRRPSEFCSLLSAFRPVRICSFLTSRPMPPSRPAQIWPSAQLRSSAKPHRPAQISSQPRAQQLLRVQQTSLQPSRKNQGEAVSPFVDDCKAKQKAGRIFAQQTPRRKFGGPKVSKPTFGESERCRTTKAAIRFRTGW
jgi:hypothetical protein